MTPTLTAAIDALIKAGEHSGDSARLWEGVEEASEQLAERRAVLEAEIEAAIEAGYQRGCRWGYDLCLLGCLKA
jgi:hypothetical protein